MSSRFDDSGGGGSPVFLAEAAVGGADPARAPLDSVKGVLIVAVVLGHSLLADQLLPWLKLALYAFHVQCFLFFPFLFRPRALTCRNMADLLVRYLVPYGLAVVFFSVLHGMACGTHLETWALNTLSALVTGNMDHLRTATGFRLYWFLPVLSVTVILWTVYFHQARWLKILWLVFAIAAHFLLPAMPWSWKRDWVLFGTHIALFIFPLGLCVRYVACPLLARLSQRGRFLLPLSCVALLWLLLRWGFDVNLSNLGYASYHQASVLIHQDLVALLALLSLLAFSRELARIPYLSEIGANSLLLYLLHQCFVAGTVGLLGRGAAAGAPPWCRWLVGSLSVLCGIVGPLLAARLIHSHARLRSIILPRSAHDLLHGLGVRSTPRTLGTIRSQESPE